MIVGIGGLLASGVALAGRPAGTYINNTYYSDASKTVVIGVRNYDCQGRLTTWGSQSMYQSFDGGECGLNGGDGPPDPAIGYTVCPVIYDPYPVVICS
jgi:hypothetical protein